MKVRPLALSLIFVLVLAACRTRASDAPQATARPIDTPIPSSTPPAPQIVQVTLEAAPSLEASESPGTVYGYTHLSADGNRVIDGRGEMPEGASLDVPLKGTPRWLAAAPMNGGSVWLAVLEDGRSQVFAVSGGQATELPQSAAAAGEGPPLLRINANVAERLMPPKEASGLTSPAILDESGRWAFITAAGEVAIVAPSGEIETRLAVNALPDARLLVDDKGRLLLLAEPTGRYAHGVLGDALEAAAIVLIDTRPEPQVDQVIPIASPAVIEGTAPLWVDMTGDGRREIVVTRSDADQGAQIVIFDESGDRIAAGPAIGRGSRWRHQLAVAPFGPGGEVELVDVLTPHIGGVVEFYRLVGDELRIVARVPGYTSHVIRSRNLDMAAAGDFDGDGQIELLLPSQDRLVLGAIRRTGEGAEVAWTAAIGGSLTSNLAAARLNDGRLVVGVGHDNGGLRIWGVGE